MNRHQNRPTVHSYGHFRSHGEGKLAQRARRTIHLAPQYAFWVTPNRRCLLDLYGPVGIAGVSVRKR